MIVLIYKGGGHLVNVPGRDLSADELIRLERDFHISEKALIDSGLYEKAKPAKAPQVHTKEKAGHEEDEVSDGNS